MNDCSRNRIFNSKTTCFTIEEIALSMVKDSFLQDKTTCFVMREGSDTLPKSITLYNNLILNHLERKVILLRKSNILSRTGVRTLSTGHCPRHRRLWKFRQFIMNRIMGKPMYENVCITLNMDDFSKSDSTMKKGSEFLTWNTRCLFLNVSKHWSTKLSNH